MRLTKTASYLIAPGKNRDDPPDIHGRFLATKGPLNLMLRGVFERSDQECLLPIRFLMSSEGKKQNPMRDLLIAFIDTPIMSNGTTIAERLRDSTTGKSHLGLLFILLGADNNNWKIPLSRFPADQGVLAEFEKGTLELEFVERVFMKNAASYKAALYNGSSYDAHLWSGMAVDRQLKTSHKAANYWIREFLASDFVTTSKEGTRRFAIALRDASRSKVGGSVKHELLAAGMLAPGLDAQIVSISDIAARFRLSDAATRAIMANLAYEDLAADTFAFDREEFLLHATHASIELDNGGLLLAPPDRFDQVFDRKAMHPETREFRFSTQGKIVDERLRGRK